MSTRMLTFGVGLQPAGSLEGRVLGWPSAQTCHQAQP